jgi:hypothetical protein
MRAGALLGKENVDLRQHDKPYEKGTRSVKRRGLAGQVEAGAPDKSLTPASGVVAVTELVTRLGLVDALDDAIGSIKQRDRGLSGGELVVSLAQAQMLGGDFLVSLDRRRADVTGEGLSVVPTPASTTAARLGARFGPAQVAGIEEGIGEVIGRVVGALPVQRRVALRGGTATLDLDGTEVEVYGPGKESIAFNYKGQRAGRPHVASWAEAGVVVAADLLAGNEDPRAGAAELVRRGVDTMRAAGVTARRGRARLATLRHLLLAVPARLVRHAGQAVLRLPPGRELLTDVLARLRRIPIHA